MKDNTAPLKRPISERISLASKPVKGWNDGRTYTTIQALMIYRSGKGYSQFRANQLLNAEQILLRSPDDGSVAAPPVIDHESVFSSDRSERV